MKKDATTGIARADHPPVFVSATSDDLGSVRRRIRETLLSLGYYPVEQTHFGPHPGTILGMIEDKVSHSAALIHIVGRCYGSEPVGQPGQRSYTQREFDIALRLEKPIYIFVCSEDFPYDSHVPESDEKLKHQEAYRTQLLAGDHQYFQVGTPEELDARIREMRLQVERVESHAEAARSFAETAASEAQAARRSLQELLPVAWWARASGKLTIAGILVLTLLAGQLWSVREESRRRDQDNHLLLERSLKFAEEIRDRTFGESPASRSGNPAERRAAAEAEVATASGLTVQQLRATLEAARQTANANRHGGLEAARIALAAGDNKGAENEARRVATAQGDISREALLLVGDAQFAAVKYADSEASYRAACLLTDLKEDEESWAESHGKLAAVLDARGNFLESLGLWQKILDIRERKNGSESPEALNAMEWVANELWSLNEFDKAENLYRRSLQIREESPVPVELPIGKACGNLAAVLRELGRYSEAEILLHRSLDIHENILGMEHPETATARGNLGWVLLVQDRLDEAEPILRRALADHKKVLGPSHPEVAVDCGNLGVALRQQNRYAEAEPLFREALKIDEKALGPTHPYVFVYRFRLADVLRGEKNQAEAGQLFHESITGLEARPDFQPRYLAEALWYSSQWQQRGGRLEQAKAEATRAVEIASATLGEQHPKTRRMKEWSNELFGGQK